MPAYNEESCVAEELKLIKKTMDDSDYTYEIILVDDASVDKTAEIVAQFDWVKLVPHFQNKGYGAALKTGIQKAKHDVIIITDADGTYPHAEIPRLLGDIDDYDMVVGARTGKGVKIPLIRRPAKWCINRLANYLTGMKIPDLNSGLRIMKKNVIEKFLRFLPNGFSWTSTITLAMLTNNYQVKYTPIAYHKRSGRSKIRPIRDTLNFLQLIIRTVVYFEPLKVFHTRLPVCRDKKRRAVPIKHRDLGLDAP